MLDDLFLGIRSLLLPSSCAGCRFPLTGEESSPLCSDCFKQLPWRSSTRFDPMISPFRYEGIAKELIAQLKYHGRLSVAPFLGQILGETVLQRLGADPADAVVPVPLHPVRLRERTFNQAQLLAQQLANNLHLPCRPDLLIRRKPTRPQSDLSRQERQRNVAEAFSIQPDPLIRSMRLLLVDDVFTTGATASVCAKLLKEAGAASVTVVTLAHG